MTTKKVTFRISEDSYIKLNLYSLMTGKTASDIIESFAQTLTKYSVHANGEEVVTGRDESPAGYIYFLSDENDGPIKIGFSRTHPHRRMKELSTGMSSEPKLLAIMRGSLNKERGLHAKFASLMVRGEWFQRDKELLSYIAEHGITEEAV